MKQHSSDTTHLMIYRALILLVPIVLFYVSARPDTFILGWDNFNSELNPTLAIRQALHAGWSDTRSMGLPAGMGYAADVLHAVVVWMLHFIVPITSIRPLILFALLGLGGQGVFALLIRSGVQGISAFIGALYAMLSFGTIQIFALPYEPFSAFFGLFPWAILTWLDALNHWERRYIFRFLLITVAVSSAMYVQTMFIVYALSMASITIISLYSDTEHRNALLKRSVMLVLMTLAVNSYWLLTQIYFLLTTVDTVQFAKQILLGWRVPFYQNIAHSSLFDFFTQFGYYTEFNGGSGKIFSVWIDHLSTPFILWIRTLLVGVLLIGLVDGKSPYKRHFLAVFWIHAFALLPTFPGFSHLHDIVRTIPMLDQIFRSPFSKFVMSQSIVFGYFIGLGIEAIQTRLHEATTWAKTAVIGVVLSILLCAYPASTGNFFAREMSVRLPETYTQLFAFFSTRSPTQRIALLPESDVWGWYVYDWGYQGSGFLWHALEQPIVSRSYDVWSRVSENEFLELKRALHAEDIDAMIATYRKYDISYIIFDEHLIIDKKGGQFTYKILEKLAQHPDISTVWRQDRIRVFEIGGSHSSPVTLITNPPEVAPAVRVQDIDTAYSDVGAYIAGGENSDFYFPFRDLQTQSYNPNAVWALEESTESFTIRTKLDAASPPYEPTPDMRSFSVLLATESGYIQQNHPLSFRHDDTAFSVTFPKIRINPSSSSQPSNCSPNAIANPLNFSVTHTSLETTITTRYGHMGCFGYNFDRESLGSAYLVQTDTQNLEGQPLMMYMTDHTNAQTLLQHQLNGKSGSTFILPPSASDAVGFSLNFQNVSYLRTPAVNTFQEPIVYAFPTHLWNISIPISEQIPEASVQSIKNFTHPIPALYKISFDLSESPTRLDSAMQLRSGTTRVLSLAQSYDDGWVALAPVDSFPYFKKIGTHVLVNNWENGWKSIPSDTSTVYLFYWPQLLQYLGFLLLSLPFLWVIFNRE